MQGHVLQERLVPLPYSVKVNSLIPIVCELIVLTDRIRSVGLIFIQTIGINVGVDFFFFLHL